MKTTPKLLSLAALALSMAAPAFAVDAPQVAVTDDILYWTPVDAISINVHRDNGEWLETIPGNATQWQAPASGGYFLVGTDQGDWQGWGKSNTVNVNAFVQNDTQSGDYAGSLVINNYYAKVYSQTSAEIFWELPSTEVVKVEVFRDDGVSLFSNGQSFYEANLLPGTTYYYTLFPYDSRGNLGPEVSITLTTASATDAGSAVPSTPMVNPALSADADVATKMDTATGSDELETKDSGSKDSRTASWSIDGNSINFAADGWFQVQRRTDYSTVCEGVSSCEIEDDTNYQIVNHLTGEVWQRVSTEPMSMSWQQTGLYLGHLYWNSVIYNYEAPSEYKVYLNDELVALSGITNSPIAGFVRGTRYRVTVYALLADGSQELVGDQEFVTDGPSMDVVSYGRPAADRDTFGFELWDNIEAFPQSFLPSDCLLALPAGDFCFSPSTRYLMEIYRFSDSQPVPWEFVLPGENSTNHIEALAHFYGTGGRRSASKRFALVADVTTVFDQSSYEISVFQGNGTFQGTFPILEDIRFSAGDGQERQINLDGADVRVTLGPEQARESDSPFASAAPRSLHIAGEYYEPNGTGSLSDLSGWRREGAFLAVIDPNTGETLSKTFYTGMTLENVPTQ